MPEAGVTFILLAAGSASRMGQPKQLLPYRGMPLVRWSATQALESECERVIAVTGANGSLVSSALEGLPITTIHNAQWEAGMGASIAAGLKTASAQGCQRALIAVADTPLITPEFYNHLLSQHLRTGLPIAASAYSHTMGVPAVFDKSLFPELLALRPSEGCKRILIRYGAQVCRVLCEEATLDIDTPEDYEKLG